MIPKSGPRFRKGSCSNKSQRPILVNQNRPLAAVVPTAETYSARVVSSNSSSTE